MSRELNGTLTNSVDLIGNLSVGAAAGTDNYNELLNKPSINDVVLQGNKTTSDLLIDYDDLLNKPTIPAAQVNSDWNSDSGLSQILNKPDVYNKASLITKSSAAIVTFSDGLSLPYNEVITNIDNDLGGISSLSIEVRKKNLLTYPYRQMDGTYGNITMTTDNTGKIHISGTNGSSTQYIYLYGYSTAAIPSWVKGGKTYAVYPTSQANKYFLQIIFYGSPTLVITGGNDATLPDDILGYTGCAIVIGINANAVVDDDIYPMVTLGAYNENETFEAYYGETVTVSLGQTVYGGYLNVTTGELTITHDSEGEITPVTSYITAYNVNCLSGYNTLYSSSGDVSCKYYNEVDTSLVELIKTISRGLS